MSSKHPVYAWDTSVFLAHLKQESDKPLADIAAVAQEVEKDDADLIVSLTTKMELLDIVDNPKIAALFEGFLQRRNVMLIDVNPTVADTVLAVRFKGNRSTPKRNVKLGDAQIVGTAIVYGADVLHTFDPGLLKLSGSPIVDGLHIALPKLLSGQKVLAFDPPHLRAPIGRHFQRDKQHPILSPHRSSFELACAPRSLMLSHR